MATTGEQLAAWKQLGGTVKTVKKTKEFIAPGGEKFSSWAEASEFAKTIEAPSKPGAEDMDVDAQKPSSKKAAPSSKPRAKRAGTAGAAADAAVAAKATKKAKASSSSPPAAPAAGVGSGRAAAQNVKYDFDVGAGSFSRRGDVVEVKAAREAEDEAAAVELLGGAQAAADGRFRLLDLAVFEDGTGELVPLDRVGLAGSRPLFASAVVTRAEGAPRSAGVAVARLGPLSGFGVDGIPSSADSDSSPVALTLTSTASGLTYVVSRASPAYRKLLAHVQEEAELAAETARVLVAALDENKKSANPATATPPSYESVVIRLARARAGKPYGGPRAALEACGAFVLETLEKHAPALVAAGAAFAAELEDKVEAARGAAGRVRGNGISIVDAADAKGKGKAPVAASAAAAAAALDPKGKGKAAVAVTASSVAAAPVSFASKASALPLPERFALREGDFARQIAAKAASAEGLVSLQVATDAAARAADGKAVDGKAFKQVTAAQAERFAARAASAAAGSGDGAYIVLSMSELADEYPAPKPAPERDADAGDEIELLGGELDFFDAGANPDELQSFDLFDFSLFNSDSMMAPLELVPAFSGGEPPVEVFAMGRMAEHDEETAFATPEQVVAAARARAAGNNNNGGGSSAGGSSSAADASPPAPIGMPLLLSQIQEWYVEGAADLDSCQLWVRTELARYRLVSPDPAYAPWHAVVLRAVRWAVRSMHAVGSASRASRVSFEDIVKEVAREPEDSVDFVSRDPRAVERFLVCHGQIVLNQFSALLQQDRTQDARAVAQCAFAQSLRSKMLERRHLKLYAPSKAALKAMQLAARKASAKSGGRAGRAPRALKTNPLKGSAAAKARAAPMTATATNMVRAVWQSYFAAAGVGRGGSGDGEAPVGDASSAVVAAKAIPLKVYAKAGIEEVKAEAGIAKEVEEADPNADDDEEEEKPDAAAAAPAAAASPADGGADARAAAAKPAAAPRPSLAPEVLGSPLPGPIDAAPLELSGSGPVSFYSRALIGEKGSSRTEVALGDVVSLAVGVELASLGDHDDVARYLAVARQRSRDAELPETPLMGIVQAIFVESAAAGKGKKAAPKVQLRVVVHGCDTVLGDAASDAELFVTPRFAAFPLADAAEKLDAQRRQRRWDPKDTSLHAAEALEDERLREGNNEKLAAGKPLSYIYRTAYLPLKGMFQILPADLGLGEPVANEPAPEKGLARGKAAVKAKGAAAAPQSATFKKDGVEYRVGDAVYLPPDAFDSEEQVEEPAAAAKKAKGKDKKSASPASDDEEEEEEEAPAVDANGKLLPGSRSRFHKGGANLGLRAFAVGVIRAIPDSTGANAKSAPITVTRCARPEDVSERVAYEAGWWDIFATSEVVSVDAAAIVRKCHVVAKSTAPAGSPLVSDAAPAAIEGVFTCVGTADLERKTVDRTKVPEDLRAADEVLAELKKENLALASSAASADAKAAEARAAASDKTSKAQGDGISLATMDIFAGCGGLSEGLHQYRAAHAKWAIEYEHPAAEAYRLNNPDAEMFEGNCNVVLAAAMEKHGASDQCRRSDACAAEVAEWRASASSEANEPSSNGRWSRLPAPGEVEFLCGGPPCQGYSGMNRFNKGNWSLVQNSMVMSYLSFADFYRPRYFLLENVRNFVSHNKSFTFRLTLRSLLEMGYSVRFGVLNAGNFGVSQSRKRTFIWAAAPGERLPEWPSVRHVFKSPQLTINLPGGVQYTAVPQTSRGGAPLRTVTVEDAIGDLPEIGNGHDDGEKQGKQAFHAGAPQSAFQRMIRSGLPAPASSASAAAQQPLFDHISKTMNDLNLERCRCIPKGVPGADWRVLKKIVADDRKLPADKQKYRWTDSSTGEPSHLGDVVKDGKRIGDLIPWCLPNTEARHNGWRGLFGRLDPRGHFPTSTTDPQPMGKVGQVFHPTQDRIVSVRECARAQGFPDDFRLWGNVHQKHRQVGNAVPVPLSAALGKQLRAALEETAAARNPTQ